VSEQTLLVMRRTVDAFQSGDVATLAQVLSSERNS